MYVLTTFRKVCIELILQGGAGVLDNVADRITDK